VVLIDARKIAAASGEHLEAHPGPRPIEIRLGYHIHFARSVEELEVMETGATKRLGLANLAPCNKATATPSILLACPKEASAQLINNLEEPRLHVESEEMLHHRGREHDLDVSSPSLLREEPRLPVRELVRLRFSSALPRPGFW
jgi:hypothetical protein